MIRINYTYYENKELLQKVVNFYEKYKNFFEFSIIDDGSQKNPLKKGDLPDYWKIYRIEEDLGWGNEVGRNILLRKTTNTWNAMMDLDLLIDLEDEDTFKFLATTEEKDSDFNIYYYKQRALSILYQFPLGGRTDYKDITKELEGKLMSINSFIISKDTFNKSYGYDMAFAWVYGNDVSLPAQMHGEVALPFGRLKKIALQAVPDRNFEPLSPEEYKGYNKLRWDYSVQGYNQHTLLWETEKQRMKHCKPYPEVVDIQ